MALLNIKNFENKITKLINFIDSESEVDLYNKMISLNSNHNLFLNSDLNNNFFEKKEFISDLKN